MMWLTRDLIGMGILGFFAIMGAVFLYYTIKQHKEDDDGLW